MEYLSISIERDYVNIRDGIDYIAKIHGNCDHVKVATLLAAAPDLLYACETAFATINKLDLDIDTPINKELCVAYDMLQQAIARSKDNTINPVRVQEKQNKRDRLRRILIDSGLYDKLKDVFE